MTSGIDAFFAAVAAAPRAVLALDYDGTLATFRERPEEAAPDPGVRHFLGRIMDDGRTRVVILSGRPARQVADLLDLAPNPEIWGAHGWERLKRGSNLSSSPVDSATADVLASAREALAVHDVLQHAQGKAASIAVHWRGRPDASLIEAAARTALAPLADAPDFELLDFAAGLELRCRRCHKGTALAAVLAEESVETPVAYLGDDLTDEDAFAVLAGRGLAMRVAPAGDDGPPPWPTHAAATIAAGEGVLAFLARWLAAAGPPRPAVAGEAP